MKKWNLIFDVALCTGCRNCELAVKDEYVGNTHAGYTAEMPRHGPGWVQIRQRERGQFPALDVTHLFHSCQHCDEAPCMQAAKDGAISKRPDGLVQIHPERAKGQKAIVEACPFRAVYWNEALQLPQHWGFDSHLLDAGWAEPRPVQSCPTGALRSIKVEDEEMRRVVAEQKLEHIEPGDMTRSRVHYRNLYRYTRAFVAGTLTCAQNGVEDCVAGASVSLTQGAEPIAAAASDHFGDFRIDGLLPQARNLRLRIAAAGYREQILEIDMDNSRWLGEIRLAPA
jgi:Fe-S-cluster-containing dehydrogenase component